MKLTGTTNSEVYGPAMKIRDQAEADDYFRQIVDLLRAKIETDSDEVDRVETEKVVRNNLGYWAGYYDQETQERVNKLFRTSHPIFGDTHPTPEEAFKKGLEMGRRVSE